MLNTESPRDLVPKFFDKTARTYDKIVNLTTFGRDKYWKKEILKKIQNCNSVLDLACGTGILTFQIAKQLPNAKITGIDVTESYLDIARTKLKPHHNVSFLHQDAEKLDLNTKFDYITSSYIPKYCKSETLIKVCTEHLNPGGKIILHDFTYPKNKLIRTLWEFYFIILNLMGFFIPNWKKVFSDLPNLIRTTRWLDEYENAMRAHNLSTVRQSLTWESSAILTGTKMV